VNQVAHQLRSEITDRIEEHLRAFLATPHQISQANANAIRQRLPSADDPDALERYLWEQIQVFDSVTSIYFGNTEGGLVDAGREGAQGDLYVIVTDEFKRGPFRKYATDREGHRAELLTSLPDFDARTRAWYTAAVEKGAATWSDIYILFTGQDMSLSASRPVYDAQQNLVGVVATDIFLSHIGDFLKNLTIGETGTSFIMERSGLLVASSTTGRPFTLPDEGEGQRRLHAAESTIPTIRWTAEFLTEQFGDYHAITGEQQLEFEIEGERQFLQVTPVQDDYGIDWLVAVIIPEADFMAQINTGNRTTAFLVSVALILAVGVGFVTAQKISEPIAHLNASAQALAQGQWDHSSNGAWIKEISELAQSFNDMVAQLQQTMGSLTSEIAERRQAEEALRQSKQRLEETLTKLRETQEQMMHQERLATVGQLAAGIAHEFNNILASIVLYTQMSLHMSKLSSKVRKRLESIAEQADDATDLVQQILDFGRRSVIERRPLALDTFLEEVVELLRRTLPKNIQIDLNLEPGAYDIYADSERVQQAIVNLALNARDAMPDGGHLHITLSSVEDEAINCVDCGPVEGETWIQVAVADDGPGIPPDVLPHIFEPFFTTRAPLGHGLGLAQVHGIVKQHGGHIEVETEVGCGTAVRLYWPALA
jgi:signal transduction histidine kinase